MLTPEEQAREIWRRRLDGPGWDEDTFISEIAHAITAARAQAEWLERIEAAAARATEGVSPELLRVLAEWLEAKEAFLDARAEFARATAAGMAAKERRRTEND